MLNFVGDGLLEMAEATFLPPKLRRLQSPQILTFALRSTFSDAGTLLVSYSGISR